MRDWHRFVREYLEATSEKQIESEQITAELAGHLEDHYESLRAQGIIEELAFERTCARTGSWEQLRRGIMSAKQEETMIDRVRQIWIPTLVTLLLSAAVLTILIWSGTQPRIWHPGEARGIIVYLPWLLFLPLAGGIGAHLSRRSQGSGWPVYVSGLSPALAWAVVFVLVTPLAFFVNPTVAPSFKITSILAMLASWVALPGLALAIGVVAEGMMKGRRAARV
jgi:hypothetical protein